MIQRVMNVAMRPSQEWPVIAQETHTTFSLYTKYILPLAAIGPVCSLVAGVLFGTRVPFTGIVVRNTFSTLLYLEIVSYVLTLLGVAVLAVIVQKLAPGFKSHGDFTKALALVTFASAPYWLSGVLSLIPILGMLSILVALYGLYLVYVGLPFMMLTPDEQRLPYLGVVVVVSIIIFVVLSALPTFVVGFMLGWGEAWK